MERRFCVKIDLHAPDEKTRKRIWKSRFSWLTDAQAASLGSAFKLCGGSICNIVKKSILYSVARNVSVSYEDLERFCREEVGTGLGRDLTRRPIGFCSPKAAI